MAVTAYRPLVVNRMAFTAGSLVWREYAISEYLSQLLDPSPYSELALEKGAHHSRARTQAHQAAGLSPASLTSAKSSSRKAGSSLAQ
ncbi:hypothetical protein D3880_05935 [Pseudomonas cavernae]|uniref:Uncharacterized protein n=1 Tax=Pseudomonas cavernae TaxID=2320867 RepID=A0A385YYI1_9PSED|nr:hypothetical protein D3880_05935 [Pseudomonas cavernae]